MISLQAIDGDLKSAPSKPVTFTTAAVAPKHLKTDFNKTGDANSVDLIWDSTEQSILQNYQLTVDRINHGLRQG